MQQQTKVDGDRDRYDTLLRGRDDAIHAGLVASPGYVPTTGGLLADMAALRTLTQKPEAALLVALIDLASFSLEMGFVAGKLFGGLEATVFCALLAAEEMVDVAKTAERLVESINNENPSPPEVEPAPVPEPPPVPGSEAVLEEDDLSESSIDDTILGFAFGGTGVPPKRPRGRPRKDSFASAN